MVRVGETVRRAQSANAAFVHELLVYLERRGFAGAPRFLGIDDSGREVLSYVPGEVPPELGWFPDTVLAAAARLLRALHDATAESSLRGRAEVVCHGDASPCNTAFHEGIPSAFIDFDAAHPGTRREDIGYAAWLWLDLGNADLSPKLQATRLGGFMRAYGGGWHEDAVLAVLDAQEALAARPAAPEAVRIWAETCRAWTFSHQSTLAHEARVADSPATRGEDSE